MRFARQLTIATSGRHTTRVLLVLFVAGASALGCARGSIPILPGGAMLPSTLTAAAGVTRTPLYLFTPGPGFQFPHAVYGKAQGETLTVRQVAGVSGGDVGELEFDQRGLTLTGNATNLGSSTWVEINRPSGGTGWVSALDLTQDVPAEAFCTDGRVLTLLEALRASIANRDPQGLQALASPRRGLTVRFDWWNPEVAYRTSEIASLMGSDTSVDWGTQLSGGPITGSFKDIVLPRLDEIAAGDIRLGCNETLIGPALREARWPSDYDNLNYYALYRPAEDTGNEYAWTTWLVGVEYVDNQPYVSLLVQLRAGI
jgi:hypothetical protein